MDEVINGNIHYYLALVDDEKKTAEIKSNTKAAREYFKERVTEVTRVFKLRGHTIDEVYTSLKEYIGEDYELVTKRNRATMPTVMPIEL